MLGRLQERWHLPAFVLVGVTNLGALAASISVGE